MGRGQYHWPPRRRDQVFSQSRMEDEAWPYGEIVSIERDHDCEENSEVVVMFQRPLSTKRTTGSFILAVDGNPFWDARNNPNFSMKKCRYTFTGFEYSFGGETDLISYWFSDFEGNWDTIRGGAGQWELD